VEKYPTFDIRGRDAALVKSDDYNLLSLTLLQRDAKCDLPATLH